MVQNSEIQKKLKCFFPYTANDSASDYLPSKHQMTSRQYTNNTRHYDGRKTTQGTTAAAAVTPFCKVCKDAGLSADVYTNHFVKDQPGPNGRVVCPTLLNQACRICNKNGHTSSYCPEYKPRRDDRYHQQEEQRHEHRRDDRYIEREPRRDDDRVRYNHQRNDISFNHLRDDTERREREIEERDREYRFEQERRSKPWLQAALKDSSSSSSSVRVPYAHPHGPRVRLALESPALSAAKHAEPDLHHINARAAAEIDVRTVQLNHSSSWADEDVTVPFVCDPVKSAQEFLESTFVTDEEFDFIVECENFGGANCY
jgi:hypothetical protein